MVSILSTSHLVAPLRWEIEERVKAAQEGQPGAQRMSEEAALRSSFTEVGHSPVGPQFLLRLPSWILVGFLNEDTRGFVKAWPICNCPKASHQAPSGFLHPLPVPHRTWSHSSVDFVSGLPPSQGHTIILRVVDRFSRVAHFMPLSKLPSANETAELTLTHFPPAWASGGFGVRPNFPVHGLCMEGVL